jgi:hypothetical protein
MNPTDLEQMGTRDWENLIGGPAPSQPNQSGNPSAPNTPSAAGMAKMLQEGGNELINFLLRAAVSSTEASGKLPDVRNVRDWHFKDLMHLPEAARKEWKTTCLEELEAL